MPDIGRDVVPPLYRPWDPDDSLDFHAARILVLLRRCAADGPDCIAGRTKLAKLDFFIRYPTFLQQALRATTDDAAGPWLETGAEVEAPMIRYRFGPWDDRYRQFLSFLEARKLVRVTVSKPERVTLTAAGRGAADELLQRPAFQELAKRCDAMTGSLASMTGTELKELIYELFPTEVGDAPLRSVIEL